MKPQVRQHAAERFIERYAPDLTLPEAVLALEKALASARLLPRRTASGEEIWRVPVPKVDLIVRRDDGDRLVVVTILTRRGSGPLKHRLGDAMTCGEATKKARRKVAPMDNEVYDLTYRKAGGSER